MKLAVTYKDGKIFQHFGHTEQFKIYVIEDGKILSEDVVDTNGSGHGELSSFLCKLGVTALICGGIGGGAQIALKDAGIAVFGGVEGFADDVVKTFIEGNLRFDPNVKCSHHDKEGDKEHTCSNHGCGGNCGNH